MNKILTKFTIRDLENLSGVKAHTIRIWEKRYGVLEPGRTQTNIRHYNIKQLQRLLNVSLLCDRGYKISKIASLPDAELNKLLRQFIAEEDHSHGYYFNQLKLAMLNFDTGLFEHIYSKMLSEMSFSELYSKIGIPFLHYVGIQWQSNTITLAHEHFISNLIIQKLHSQIDKCQRMLPENQKEVFVLFLPMGEIHEIALLYIQYELILAGNRVVYLGQSVAVEHLVQFSHLYSEVIFLSCFTTHPSIHDLDDYFSKFQESVLKGTNHSFWVTGSKISQIHRSIPAKQITLFNKMEEILNKI